MRLHRQVFARAERAADPGHRQPHLVSRKAEHRGELLLVDMQPLGRDAQLDAACTVWDRKTRLRAERRLVLHSDLVLAADHDVGPRSLVAVTDLHVAQDLALFRPRDRRQHLVFDPHLLCRTPRLFGMLGSDEGEQQSAPSHQ